MLNTRSNWNVPLSFWRTKQLVIVWQGRASSCYDSRCKKKSTQCSVCRCQFLVELQIFFHLFLSIGFESIESFHFKKNKNMHVLLLSVRKLMPAWTQLVKINIRQFAVKVLLPPKWGGGNQNNHCVYYRFYHGCWGIWISHCEYGIIAMIFLVLWVMLFWTDGQ